MLSAITSKIYYGCIDNSGLLKRVIPKTIPDEIEHHGD